MAFAAGVAFNFREDEQGDTVIDGDAGGFKFVVAHHLGVDHGVLSASRDVVWDRHGDGDFLVLVRFNVAFVLGEGDPVYNIGVGGPGFAINTIVLVGDRVGVNAEDKVIGFETSVLNFKGASGRRARFKI